MKEIPKLFMLVGLPGSGKTAYGEQLAKKYNAKLRSSDKVRDSVIDSESVEERNKAVFRILHEGVVNDLKSGNNSILDATNLSSRRRSNFISQLRNISCEKICTIVAAPYETCIRNLEKNNLLLPSSVIKNMYMQFEPPYYYEGWDKIIIHYPRCSDERKYQIYDLFYGDDGLVSLDQDNPNHSETVGNHCIKTYEQLHERAQELFTDNEDFSNEVYFAALLHDIGKKFTKSFIDHKGRSTSVAHYYNHEKVSAYDSLFLDIANCDKLRLATIINLHMKPKKWSHGKTETKYRNKWGGELFLDVMHVHRADMKAH